MRVISIEYGHDRGYIIGVGVEYPEVARCRVVRVVEVAGADVGLVVVDGDRLLVRVGEGRGRPDHADPAGRQEVVGGGVVRLLGLVQDHADIGTRLLAADQVVLQGDVVQLVNGHV